MDILPHADCDRCAIDALLERCFGPARGGRTAGLVRSGAQRIERASFLAVDSGRLVGSIECHALVFRPDDAADLPLVWLGPLAADPGRRGEGIGALLMAAALAALGDAPVALIGDAPYYGRWGFCARPTARWRLPGPVARERLLLRAADPAPFQQPGAPLAAAGRAAAA